MLAVTITNLGSGTFAFVEIYISPSCKNISETIEEEEEDFMDERERGERMCEVADICGEVGEGGSEGGRERAEMRIHSC